MLENDLHRNMVISVKDVTSTITAPAIVDKGSQFTITCVAEGYRAPHYIALEKDDITVKTWVLDSECISPFFYQFKCSYSVPHSGELRCQTCSIALPYLSNKLLRFCGVVHSYLVQLIA